MFCHRCGPTGPADCAPTSSGRPAVNTVVSHVHQSPLKGFKSSQRLLTLVATYSRVPRESAAIALALRQPGQLQEAQTQESQWARASTSEPGSTASLKGRVRVMYEEEEDVITVPASSSSKLLRVNMDLTLWRCRQARIKALNSTDKEERRQLLAEGEENLRRCLSMDPSDPRTYVVLGKLLMMQKRYQEARTLYSEGVANTGNANAFIWASWGWLEFKTGDMARARKLFDAAIVVDNTHACAWHKWGMLEKSEGNYTRARDLWMQGIQACRRRPQSQNAYLYNGLAVMASELGRVEEARAWFEEGTRTLEGAASVALWQAWAVMEAKQGDATAVRYLFKKALLANPRSRFVHLAWALWERKLGNPDLCVQLLKRGQAFNPTDAAIYQAWAIVEKERGDYEAAAKLFEDGLRADPGHLPLWQAWGVMESQRGNLDRARELYQQGVWADPSSKDTVYVFHAWGVLEYTAGNTPLARELFKAAIKVDPKNENVWETWIKMEQELGFLARADELNIRRAEQQWEFEVPAGFTTRPGDASPLSTLVDTLSRFFKVRSSGAAPAGVGAPAAATAAAKPGSVRQFLPDDYQADLRVEDIIPSFYDAHAPGATNGGPSGASHSAAAAHSAASTSSASTSRQGSAAAVPSTSAPEDARPEDQLPGTRAANAAARAARAKSLFAPRPVVPTGGGRGSMSSMSSVDEQ